MRNFRGFQNPSSAASEYNAIEFIARQILNQANTATLVQVVSVTNAGSVSPVGFVDVQPLVNQLDGFGNSKPRGGLFHLPYFRLQGGTNAVILDPQVGDIGIAVIADRDISAVKATKAQSNPGSRRRFDIADGMYLGGLLNGTPSQYVQFTGSGINVVSPTKVTLSAPAVEIDASTSFTVNSAAITLNGPVTGTSTITAPTLSGTTEVMFGGKASTTHKHGGVQTGSGTSGVPV